MTMTAPPLLIVLSRRLAFRVKRRNVNAAAMATDPTAYKLATKPVIAGAPAECTKSIIDTSADPECNRGNEVYDQADILTVNIRLPEGDTIDYNPAVLSAFLYECPDENTPMPVRPPDGGSWENQVVDPGPPPYTIEIRGITYYRESLIEGRHCVIVQLSQKNAIPPIPEAGDYFYWDPTQGFVFPLEGEAETANVTLERIGG